MSKWSARKIMSALLILIFVLSITAYALFEFRHVLAGPEIRVANPQNGSLLEENIITIEGETRNISFLSLNDGEIFIDREGGFSETRSFAAGYNVIEIYGRDRHGKEAVKKLEFFID